MLVCVSNVLASYGDAVQKKREKTSICNYQNSYPATFEFLALRDGMVYSKKIFFKKKKRMEITVITDFS